MRQGVKVFHVNAKRIVKMDDVEFIWAPKCAETAIAEWLEKNPRVRITAISQPTVEYNVDGKAIVVTVVVGYTESKWNNFLSFFTPTPFSLQGIKPQHSS